MSRSSMPVSGNVGGYNGLSRPRGFTGLPAVVGGASGLMIDLVGDCGAHARTVVGVAALPLGWRLRWRW
jgi:hypothetical protein